jgi:hypothetical protein
MEIETQEPNVGCRLSLFFIHSLGLIHNKQLTLNSYYSGGLTLATRLWLRLYKKELDGLVCIF